MESKFNTLPPHKRFRLMQQQQQEEQKELNLNHSNPFNLPAKKRKEARNINISPQPTPTVYLPAKKRIWAHNPLTEIDLNVEYQPPLETPQKIKKITVSKNDHDDGTVCAVCDTTDDDPSDPISPENIRKINDKDDEKDDDGIVCAVCDSTDGDPSDPIVFCDGCDLMVHSSCYGSPLAESIPDGDWFCAQCLNKDGIFNFNCSLCPNLGGAMKRTKDGKWAHIVCALLVPEVFFDDSKGREGIDCSRVPKRRYEKMCYVCEGSNGCAIDCSEPNCELSFHVSCGFGEDLCIEYRDGGKKRGGVVAAFCKEHTELWEKQQQTGKYKIVARNEGKK